MTRGQSLNQFLIFLCSTFFAHLSDMVGRRPCLIVAFAGNFFPSIAFLLWAVRATHNPQSTLRLI